MLETKEAIQYFKERAGFSRLFLEFAKKIESLGSTGGSVTLTKLSADEKAVLRNWFQKDYSSQQAATISLKKFEEKFKDTRFEGAALYEVVEGVIGRKLLYKKDEKEEFEKQKRRYFDRLNHTYMNEFTSILTEYIHAKKTVANGFIASYNRDGFDDIEKIYKALYLLPLNKASRLPLFAEKVTGNPHSFDGDTKFLSALQMIREVKFNIPFQTSPNAETTGHILFDFGILKDDLTNYVSHFGLMGEKDGKVLNSWKESYVEGSVRNEPLREVSRLDKVMPIRKEQKAVYVVENSGVFSSIVDELSHLPFSIMCTHGQFKIAALQMIKLLVEEGCAIYYAGDFDPEGLQMAYSLKQKYPHNIHYWRYNVEEYQNMLSAVDLTLSRLKKLDNIVDVEMEPLIQKMKEIKKAAYQEKHIKKLIKDIEKGANKILNTSEPV